MFYLFNYLFFVCSTGMVARVLCCHFATLCTSKSKISDSAILLSLKVLLSSFYR